MITCLKWGARADRQPVVRPEAFEASFTPLRSGESGVFVMAPVGGGKAATPLGERNEATHPFPERIVVTIGLTVSARTTDVCRYAGERDQATSKK